METFQSKKTRPKSISVALGFFFWLLKSISIEKVLSTLRSCKNICHKDSVKDLLQPLLFTFHPWDSSRNSRQCHPIYRHWQRVVVAGCTISQRSDFGRANLSVKLTYFHRRYICYSTCLTSFLLCQPLRQSEKMWGRMWCASRIGPSSRFSVSRLFVLLWACLISELLPMVGIMLVVEAYS